jgi:alpha-galactosidase
MLWNTEKFPRGLPWLTGYLKSIGFLPGIYTDAGNLSCGGYPGAFGYEELDAKTFESWGFTYLKLDGCNMPRGTEDEYKATYGKWHDILSKLDQPMVFSESAPAYFAEAANLTDWSVYLSIGSLFPFYIRSRAESYLKSCYANI